MQQNSAMTLDKDNNHRKEEQYNKATPSVRRKHVISPVAAERVVQSVTGGVKYQSLITDVSAPAKIAFSSFSFTMDAGRSITSPAAIWLARCSDRI
ncbi:hypothetical protein LED50_26935 [Salmonella enterica]|nr:hypothetical protein [Salmonella enterica]